MAFSFPDFSQDSEKREIFEKELETREAIIYDAITFFQEIHQEKHGFRLEFIENAAEEITLEYFSIIYYYFKEFVRDRIESSKIASSLEMAVCRIKPIAKVDGDISLTVININFAIALSKAFSSEVKSWHLGIEQFKDEDVINKFHDIMTGHSQVLLEYYESGDPENVAFPLISNAEHWKLVEYTFYVRQNLNEPPHLPICFEQTPHISYYKDSFLTDQGNQKRISHFEKFNAGFSAIAIGYFDQTFGFINNASQVICSKLNEIVGQLLDAKNNNELQSFELSSAVELAVIQCKPIILEDKSMEEVITALYACCAGTIFSSINDELDLAQAEAPNNGLQDAFRKIIEDHRLLLQGAISNDPDALFPLYCNAQYWRLVEFSYQLKENLQNTF